MAVEPGDQLLRPERKTTTSDRGSEGDQVDSASPAGKSGHHTGNKYAGKWQSGTVVLTWASAAGVSVKSACEVTAELVEALQSVLALGHPRSSRIPAFLMPTLCNIIISLARLPLVNSYARVPPLVRRI